MELLKLDRKGGRFEAQDWDGDWVGEKLQNMFMIVNTTCGNYRRIIEKMACVGSKRE